MRCCRELASVDVSRDPSRDSGATECLRNKGSRESEPKAEPLPLATEYPRITFFLSCPTDNPNPYIHIGGLDCQHNVYLSEP